MNISNALNGIKEGRSSTLHTFVGDLVRNALWSYNRFKTVLRRELKKPEDVRIVNDTIKMS